MSVLLLLVVTLGLSGNRGTLPGEIVKLILDHPSIENYLHPEVPGRLPVLVSQHLVAQGVRIEKYGRAVRFLPDSEIEDKPHLRFTRVSRKRTTYIVLLEYKYEGVHATITIAKGERGDWEVKSAQVGEY